MTALDDALDPFIARYGGYARQSRLRLWGVKQGGSSNVATERSGLCHVVNLRELKSFQSRGKIKIEIDTLR